MMDPTAVIRKRNTSTSSAPHQTALDPVLEERSENGRTDDETDEESLGVHFQTTLVLRAFRYLKRIIFFD